MNQDIELLNYIHQNSEMGQNTTKQLIEITDDESFKRKLESHYYDYKKIYDESNRKISDMNRESKDINMFSKASSHLMIDFKTLVDKSPSHISQMLIQGSTMGIIDMTKKLNEYNNIDKEIHDLGNQLLQFEIRNVDELKQFLN